DDLVAAINAAPEPSGEIVEMPDDAAAELLDAFEGSEGDAGAPAVADTASIADASDAAGIAHADDDRGDGEEQRTASDEESQLESSRGEPMEE
ncbi:MAG TPA: hypothetical protein VFO89_14875, partial [Thermoanaerobaculia bacterium]|nr:hypothetical protein [Thermoanaerobaculia bacterium]